MTVTNKGRGALPHYGLSYLSPPTTSDTQPLLRYSAFHPGPHFMRIIIVGYMTYVLLRGTEMLQ